MTDRDRDTGGQPGVGLPAGALRESSESAGTADEAAPPPVAQRPHDGPVGVDREASDVDADESKKKKKKKKKTKGRGGLGSDRGIETMFRTSYRTHLELSSLADTKANIMISINGIIISITIASISPKIDANPWLIIPTSVLLLACLGSMIFAILAARPRISSSQVDLSDVRSNKANILFFGNFVNMKEEDFLVGMRELMSNTDRLYSNMVRDIYSLGGVLSRKYALVRVAYTIFMWGLGTAVLLYVAVLVWVYTWAGGPGFIVGP